MGTFGEVNFLFRPEILISLMPHTESHLAASPCSLTSVQQVFESGQNLFVFDVAIKCEIMTYRYLDRVLRNLTEKKKAVRQHSKFALAIQVSYLPF